MADGMDFGGARANMKSCYLVERGVTVMASQGSSVFKAQRLKEPLQFDKPMATSDEEMTFTKGHWVFKVPIGGVTYCEWDGALANFYRGREILEVLERDG
jgi:hypothetical protein